jgi:pimeloyl-ACP methyl ester carboxylesterase
MLSASRIASSPETSRVLVMLHGIYGWGRNWQTIARAVIAARPEYACWLVDLPHHGDSGAGTHGATVRGLAADLDDWLAAEGIRPDVILGHSFGGKVALASAAHRPGQALQIWVIDSTPDTREPSGSAWDMLRVIGSLPPRFTSREEASDALVAAGYAPGVGRWMSTNLVRDGDAFAWRLDFGVMEELMRDFFTADLWPVVERTDPSHELHFLKASESSVVSPEVVARVEALASARVTLHQRDGGHWIHAESPEVVAALLVEHLP